MFKGNFPNVKKRWVKGVLHFMEQQLSFELRSFEATNPEQLSLPLE